MRGLLGFMLLGMLLLPTAVTAGETVPVAGTTVTEHAPLHEPGPLAAPATYHGEEEARNHTCSGYSPLSPACTTGLHTMLDRSLYMRIEASAGFEGIIENRIGYLDPSQGGLGFYVFRCTIVDATASCTSDGEVPPTGTRVLHDCRTYDPGTGQPGGQGAWSCTFRPAYWK